MSAPERRTEAPDRRRVPRGGRRTSDRPGRFPTVLIAESYEGARLPCVRYLDRLGFRVEQAVDGDEAIASVRQTPPHVVLMESGLPQGPLPQLIERIRACANPDMPIIVLTSELDPETETAARLPLVAVLGKPFTLASMVQEVRRLLRAQPPVVQESERSAAS